MLDLYLTNGEAVRLDGTEAIIGPYLDFSLIQFIDHTPEDLQWAKEHYGIDLSIMDSSEDIEISSHFLETETQSAFHFPVPYYAKKHRLDEESIFIIFTNDRLFTFNSLALHEYLSETYGPRQRAYNASPMSVLELFQFYIDFLGGYYADLTEHIARRIKHLAARILVKKEIDNSSLDIITLYKFNNLLLKESVIEFVRVLTLFRKHGRRATPEIVAKIDTEINDVSVVTDYVQFNFERLDDLKENVSNKIELEQNRIVKILTMVTVCIALPTMIAGIYGMNFKFMPELEWEYSYPAALAGMLLSIIAPIVYFKRKKWL